MVPRRARQGCGADRSDGMHPTAQVMQVHDEIILEARAEGLPEVLGLLEACLHSAAALTVPLKTKVRCGPSWGALAVAHVP